MSCNVYHGIMSLETKGTRQFPHVNKREKVYSNTEYRYFQ